MLRHLVVNAEKAHRHRVRRYDLARSSKRNSVTAELPEAEGGLG